MHKLLPFFIFCLSLFQNAVAQTNFSEVDAHAKNYRSSGTNLNKIADDLTRPFQTETGKARAIFVWITDNIRYDYPKAINPKDIRITYRTEEEHAQKLAALRKKQLDRTLRLKKGICEDYSMLFKKLCDRVGIDSKIIVGYARENPNAIGRPAGVSDHAWNAVNLEGSWYLLDPTWGAGTVDGNGRFEKEIRTEYFKVLPSDFIKSHFPENEDDQLLSRPIDAREFGNQPLAGFGYLKYGVYENFPEEGVIDGQQKSIRFKLKMTEKIEGRFLLFENNKGRQITPEMKNGYLEFTYFLKNKRGKTLMLGVVEGTEVYEILSYKVR